MKKQLIILLILILILNVCTACKETDDAPTVESKALSDFLLSKEKIALYGKASSFLKLNNFNGTVLIGKGDEVLFAKGFGYSDFESKTENTIDTVYTIASTTKQFTAAAIMQLCEVGKLSVDDTIDLFFPEYEQAKQITVRDLLTMRSGLREYTEITFSFMDDPLGAAENLMNNYPEMYSILIGDVFTENPIDQKDFLPYIFSEYEKTAKNGEFCYNNSNYLLLGLIIEQITGITYEEYIEQEFFDKVGMSESNLDGKTTATGHLGDTPFKGLNSDLLWAAGGICSNVTDMFKWNRALFSGEVVEPTTLNEMITPIGEDSYGYGLKNDNNVIHHQGNVSYFSGTNIVDTNNDITVVLLTNHPKDCDAQGFGESLLKLAGGEF